MAKITTAELRKGMYVLFRGEPHQIAEFQHVNPGKGSAFIRTKLKNVGTGKVLDFTYKSGETLEELEINTREMQYLYKDQSGYLFMDKNTFDQYALSEKTLGRLSDYLREGETYQIFVHGEKAIGIRSPKKVQLKVVEAHIGAKGNTVTAATKTVTLETGAVATVPLFIKEGDIISVNPETGEYLERS